MAFLSYFTAFSLVVVVYSKPNVLFVVSDDLRPALGTYGNSRVMSPTIDALANRSLVFTRAFVQQAVCGPSRTSFLTGRRPDTTRLFSNRGKYWREAAGNFTTLPQYFKENGYFTASFGKVFHHGSVSGNNDDSPYSWSIPPYHAPTQKFTTAKVCSNPDGSLHRNLLCPVDVSKQPDATLPDIQITDQAIQLLNNHLPTQPFFFAIGYHKPHIPFKFPKEYLDYYQLENIDLPLNRHYPPGLPTVAWEPWSDVRKREDVIALNVSFPYGPMPDDFSRRIIQHYYAATTYMDDQFGRVLNSLRENGLDNNTVIVFFGDHGWQLGEHQEWAKFSNFETATRTPLLFHIPPSINDTFVPSRSDKLVELVDLMPTLSDVCGLAIPPTCPANSTNIRVCTEGHSFSPLLYNPSLPWKSAVFSQYPRPGDKPSEDTDSPMLANITIMGYSIRVKQYRYTEWIGFNHTDFTADWSDVHARELYSHEDDNEENVNLAGDEKYADIVSRLTDMLKEGWRAALPGKRAAS